MTFHFETESDPRGKSWRSRMLRSVDVRFGHGVPWCTEERCRHFDGKRCGLTGFRPASICEPGVLMMGELLDADTTTIKDPP